jgi:CHASE3 domain sensor protein
MDTVVINIDPLIAKIFGGILLLLMSLIGYFLNRMIRQFDRGITEIKEVKQNIAELSSTIKVYGERSNGHEDRINKLERHQDEHQKIISDLAILIGEHRAFHGRAKNG